MDNHSLEQKFNDFLEDLNIPQLNEEKSFLDKDLTINELKEALNSFADNKSPGEDGFLQRNFTKLFLIFSARTFLILIMRLSAKAHYLLPRNEEQ